MNVLRRVTRVLATCSCVILLTGCATTQMNSQWKSPNFIGGLPKGGQVLVLCQSRDDALRRVCEDHWSVQIRTHGMTAVRSYTLPGFPLDGGANPNAIKAAAHGSGARAVLTMHLALSDYAVINPGPQVGVGIGGGSGGYHGGGFSFGGFGVSFPVGGATATYGMSSSTTLTDISSGELVWSGNASTAADADVNAQVSALIKVTAEALKKAGF